MPEQVSSYRLEAEIAHGGMGIVYRGVHTVFDQVVAIKAIFPELTVNPELRQRFMNEAKIQYKLQHPNIVQLREFLIDQGKFYIVMEYIDGETLAQHLRQLGRPMLAGEAVPIFHQALEGLGFAHAHGVIHRDIKPSNIMLTRDGVVKLTDFGIARALGTAKLTRTGTALGTPAYMSPEQIQGTKLDHRTDIYSMGITLYEMLTGRVPFERPIDSDSDFSILTAHINQSPTPPSQHVADIPLFLEAAILKALEKRPENRFASCQEFQAAIAPPPLRETVVFVPVPEPVKPVQPPPEPAGHEEAPPPPGLEAKEPAPGLPVSILEPHPGPKLVTSPPTGVRLKTVKKQSSHRALAVSLIVAAVIVIAAALSWVYWLNRFDARENPNDGLKYVRISPGTFMMGCSPGDPRCQADELPSHRVTITKGFWMGQTEVTVRAYKRFAGATGRQMPNAPQSNSRWANDAMPIVNVNWQDAREYCTWAGGRLPTEAEWEYAARGGSTAARYGPLGKIAWYKETSMYQTHEVGQKRANGFGLFDTLGNAWEWVNDWFDFYYYQNSPSQDPAGPAKGHHRTARGGSVSSADWDIRESARIEKDPVERWDELGVRCVWEAGIP
jgi:serine/threonine-protein kinase